MHLGFYMSPSDHPHETLALEEAILNHLGSDDVILYLYRHRPSVIIGRTQNAWAECRHELLEQDGGVLARRISGGGAVYHDPQNLNFSFIVSSDLYNLEKQLGVIVAAVRSFGIDAAFSGRNDILADGRKFSGNAFCRRRQGSFHHGTILINTDGARMSRYLSVAPDKIKSKGVKSVRSRVVNLRELAPEITLEAMQNALFKSFQNSYGPVDPWKPDPATLHEAGAIARRNGTWDWLYGSSPSFDITAETRFPWGGLEMQFSLAHGSIAGVQVFSDAMDPDFILQIPEALKNVPFRSTDICNALDPLKTEGTRSWIQDIQTFIESRGF